MDPMNSWILSMKVLLISAGAVSIAMAVKFSVDEAPAICAAILPWMKPPYLFVVINVIIITIVACSRSNQNQPAAPQRVRYERLISVRTPPAAHFAPVIATPRAAETEPEAALVVYEGGDRIVELRAVLVNGTEVGAETDEEAAADDTEAEAGDMFEDFTTSLNDDLPEENFRPELQLECYNPSPASEKPQISPSFPHRNLIRTTTPEGVEATTEEAGQVTLESVWKRITESSRREPAGEHLNHSDTAERRRLEKSETFRERRSHHHSPPPRKDSSGLLKEITPSRDELNRQAEDFIKKVYEEMRLERLESLNKRVLSSGA